MKRWRVVAHPPKPNSKRSEYDSKLHDQNDKNQDPHHFFHEKLLSRKAPFSGRHGRILSFNLFGEKNRIKRVLSFKNIKNENRD